MQSAQKTGARIWRRIYGAGFWRQFLERVYEALYIIFSLVIYGDMWLLVWLQEECQACKNIWPWGFPSLYNLAQMWHMTWNFPVSCRPTPVITLLDHRLTDYCIWMCWLFAVHLSWIQFRTFSEVQCTKDVFQCHELAEWEHTFTVTVNIIPVICFRKHLPLTKLYEGI